jgi:hypothetical protein
VTITVASAMSLWSVMIAILNGFPEWLSQTPEISVKSKSNPAMTGLDRMVFICKSFFDTKL